MKRLKLGFWLLAWSCWLWLGFGLHRELPRKFGPPICRLPSMSGIDSTIGFILDSNEVLVLKRTINPDGSLDRQRTKVQVVDAETGILLRETMSPYDEVLVRDLRKQLKRGVLFARAPPGQSFSSGLHRLDLKTMKWTRVADESPIEIDLHPDKPWFVFAERLDPGLSGVKVFAVNYESLNRFEVCSLPIPYGLVQAPFYIAGDRVVVIANDVGRAGLPNRLDVWEAVDPPRRASAIEQSRGFKRVDSISRTGRMVMNDPLRANLGAVYDVTSQQRIFTLLPEGRTAAAPVRGGFSPFLSESGRSILTGDPVCLWSVDSSEPIWRPAAHELAMPRDSQLILDVTENWHRYWVSLLSSLKYTTYAYRSLESGSLLHRTADSNFIYPSLWNSAGTLAIDIEGGVHRLPLPVNYPLLALCQTILALPLIMLWAVLRWRRRRPARRETAEAAQ